MISRLENYREQTVDFDRSVFQGIQESPVTGKRRLIQSHLRDRLFEISRRNRLIYFKPTLQTLNLTVASVPLLAGLPQHQAGAALRLASQTRRRGDRGCGDVAGKISAL
jgi:hypothetical protein